MAMRLLLGCLALFAPAAFGLDLNPPAQAAQQQAPLAAQTVPATYAGVALELVIPAGYCLIPRDTAAGWPYHQLQEQMNRGYNKVGAIFADCEEWRIRERDPNYRIQQYGLYLMALAGGEEVKTPATWSRADYLKRIAESQLPSEEIQALARERAKATTVKSGEMGTASLGLSGRDDAAAYMTAKADVKYPDETAQVCAVSGMTIVRHVAVALNLYQDFKGQASLDELMLKQQANMKALVDANPD